MLDYHTGLDKLGSKIEFDNAVEQRETLEELREYIIKKYKSVYFKEIKRLFFNKYYFYYNRKTIFGIVTGCYKKKNPKATGYYPQYYINITFSGLRRYDEKLDEITKDVLYSVYAFLHTKEILYTNTAADIYLDIKAPLKNIVSLCVKKAPSVKYNKPNEEQEKININYVEKVSPTNYNKTALRGYWYNKGKRAKLKYNLTRFELKLQPKYFYKYGFSLESMEKALDKYYVLFFQNIDEKQQKIDKYSNYKYVAKRELKKLEFDKYKLKFDITAIKKFLNLLDGAYDEELLSTNDKEEEVLLEDKWFSEY